MDPFPFYTEAGSATFLPGCGDENVLQKALQTQGMVRAQARQRELAREHPWPEPGQASPYRR